MCAALRDTLEAKGVLRDVRARMQAEVFASVNEPVIYMLAARHPCPSRTGRPLCLHVFLHMQDDVRPALNNDKLLLNELIREYLEFSGYRNALSVFLTGANLPCFREPVPRPEVEVASAAEALLCAAQRPDSQRRGCAGMSLHRS